MNGIVLMNMKLRTRRKKLKAILGQSCTSKSTYYKHSPKPFGQTKNGLVSERLACTSGKIEILNKIRIQILILNFQVNLKWFFHPKNLTSGNNNP